METPAGIPSTVCFVRNRFRLDQKGSETREYDGHFCEKEEGSPHFIYNLLFQLPSGIQRDILEYFVRIFCSLNRSESIFSKVKNNRRLTRSLDNIIAEFDKQLLL